MRQMNMRIWWLAVAGVVLGLGAQEITGAAGADKKNRQLITNSASSVINKAGSVKERLLPVDRRVVRITNEKKETSSLQEPLYRPPKRGAPGGRVGGGTRGPSTDLPLMWALVPDHVGLSAEAQPLLVWYLSKPTTLPLEFTVIDEVGLTPLIEHRLSSPTEQGLHIIPLADYDLSLEKGKPYQWFVSLISDPEHRSSDIIVGGMIQADDIPTRLGEEARNASPLEAARLWAQAGFWYDAIGVISTSLQADPSNSKVHDLWASLLEEVDLDVLAQMDRQQAF